MKKAFYLYILMFLSIAAFGTGKKNSCLITSSGNGTFTVHYQGDQTGKVLVAIYDNKKNLLFTEVILNVNMFSRPYNFTGLPSGEYSVIIEDTTGKQEEIIVHQVSKEKRFFKLPSL